MTNDLTVILPLYGNAQYTRSWLENNLSDYFDCIVADGSTDESNSQILEALQHPNVRYLRYPADVSAQRYVEKICDAVGHVRTKYVMICDNDDLLLHRGIKRCIEVLGTRADFECAGGPIYGAWGREGMTNRFSLPFVTHDPAPLDGAKGLDGITRVNNNYRYFWYSVFRTDCYRRMWDETRKIDLSNFYLVELFNSDLAALAGYCHIREGHYLRLANPRSSAAAEISKTEGTHAHKIFFDDEYRGDVIRMARRLGELAGCSAKSVLDLKKNYYLKSFGAKAMPRFFTSAWRWVAHRLPVFSADQVRSLVTARSKLGLSELLKATA